MKSEIGYFVSEKQRAVKLLSNKYQNDSLQNSQDSLILLLQTANTLQTDYQLVNVYLQQKDVAIAEQLFEQIPAKYELTQLQIVEHEKMSEIIDLQIALITANRTIQKLTELERQTLNELATDTLHKAGGVDRNILTINELAEFTYGIIIPILEAPQDYSTPPEMPNLVFNLSPNPADDYFIVEYELPVYNFTNGSFSMFNFENKKVYEQQLTNRVYQLLIETASFTPGTYVCKLSSDGKEYAQELITIKADQMTTEQSEQSEELKTRIDLQLLSSPLAIFPNPANDFVVVKYNFTINNFTIGNIIFTDNTGKIVKTEIITTNTGQQTISTTNLSKGMYNISIQIDGIIIETNKIIIE